MIKFGVLEQVESFRATKAEAKRKRDTLILVIMTVFVHERNSYGHFKWIVVGLSHAVNYNRMLE